MSRRVCIFITFGLICCCSNTWADETLPRWSAMVIRVSDGDSITVSDNMGGKSRIRIYGIDCPELSQPAGEDARDFLESALLGKTVAIEVIETDKYGRYVAFVYRSGESVGEMMMEKGYAWVYEKYCLENVCDRYRELQRLHIKAKTGLWSAIYPDPIFPWEWRTNKRAERQRRNQESNR